MKNNIFKPSNKTCQTFLLAYQISEDGPYGQYKEDIIFSENRIQEMRQIIYNGLDVVIRAKKQSKEDCIDTLCNCIGIDNGILRQKCIQALSIDMKLYYLGYRSSQ